MRIIFNLVAMALMFACGCGRVQDRVLVRVNGRSITESFLRGVVLIRAKMSEARGQRITSDSFVNWGETCARQIFPGLITSELWLQRIEASGEEKPEVEDEKAALASYNAVMGKNAKSLDELARQFGAQEEDFKVQFNRSVLFTAYQRRHMSNEVSKSELSDYFLDLSNRLEQATVIDTKARKNGEAAWKRLRAGEPWDKVAAEMSEDRLVDPENADFAQEWAAVGTDGFGYPRLAAALLDMKAGDISKPIETDEGLMIVRVNALEGKSYVLSRILFRMAEHVEISSEQEAVNFLSKEKKNRGMEALAVALHQGAKIEYPEGTNVNFRIFAEDPRTR